ncbi:DUF1998 domain-containing protein [Streptomyces sp. NPDC085927]|uniref:DUF1998 domain-containing protein n=1 Tax=Streptomyces sp. NPDC085927 TaxID=3365738 RepID=UPI0037D6200E
MSGGEAETGDAGAHGETDDAVTGGGGACCLAARGPQRRPGQTPPRRSWYGDGHMSTDTADVHEGTTVFTSGHTTTWPAGARGEMVVVSEGPGGAGYEICDRCGWGRPHARGASQRAGHPHLLKDAQCTGPLRVVSLAHRYQTDFLQIRLDPLTALCATRETLRSGLHALLEGAATHLEIGRDDIDGTVRTGTDGLPSLVLFDTTPDGAGNAIRIGEHLEPVVEAAFAAWADASAARRAAATHACEPFATSASTRCCAVVKPSRCSMPWRAEVRAEG